MVTVGYGYLGYLRKRPPGWKKVTIEGHRSLIFLFGWDMYCTAMCGDMWWVFVFEWVFGLCFRGLRFPYYPLETISFANLSTLFGTEFPGLRHLCAATTCAMISSF